MNLRDKYRALLMTVGQQEPVIKNLFDKNSPDILYDTRLRTGGLSPVKQNGFFVSPYIPVTAGRTYLLHFGQAITAAAYSTMVWYNSSKIYISYTNNVNAIDFSRTAPDNAVYMRFTGLMSDKENITVFEQS